VTFSDFYNLESLVLPDSQVHPFYTPSSRPIFGDGGDVRRDYGGVRRCYGGARRCYGGVMAVLWRCSAMLWRCYGGVRRCSARLWRDLDDALKDELYRIRGRALRRMPLGASIHDRDTVLLLARCRIRRAMTTRCCSSISPSLIGEKSFGSDPVISTDVLFKADQEARRQVSSGSGT